MADVETVQILAGKGASIKHVHTEGQGGGNAAQRQRTELRSGRDFSRGGCVNLWTRREGSLKNPNSLWTYLMEEAISKERRERFLQ